MPPNETARSLSRAWCGRRAFSNMQSLLEGAPPKLELDATRLERSDACTGLAVTEVIARHLAADRGHEAVMIEPRQAEAFALLASMINPLRRPARWAGLREHPPVHPDVLLPVKRLRDAATNQLLTEFLRQAGTIGRVPLPALRLMAMAAAHLADNDQTHRPVARKPGLLCVAREPQTNNLQVCCLSVREPPSAKTDAAGLASRLRDALSEPMGGLGSIRHLSRGPRLNATMRIWTGPIRLTSRGDAVSTDVTAPFFPGFATLLEIHL